MKNLRENSRYGYIYTIPFIAMGIIGFLFSYFAEWYADPIAYKYFQPPGLDDLPERYVNGLKDIWYSQCNHYNVTNGRFFIHFIVQIFCGLLGKFWFAVCNGAVWGALPWLTVKFCSNGKYTFSASLTACMLIFGLLLPLRFDPAFQINYAWSALLLVGWLMIFFGKGSHSIAALICAGLFSFLCGESNESFSVPMCMAAAAYACARRFRLTPMQWICAVFLGIGAIVLVMAPGNWLRFSSINPEFKHNIGTISAVFPGLLIPAVCILILWCRRDVLRQHLSAIMLFILVLVLTNFSIGIFTGYGSGARMLVAGGMGLIIAVLTVLRDKPLRTPVTAIALGACLVAGSIHAIRAERFNDYDRSIYSAYASSPDGTVYVPDSLFADYFHRTQYSIREYRMESAARNPGRPMLRVRPESMRQLMAVPDTNMTIALGPQTWLLIRSVSHPAQFTLSKHILPSLLDVAMPDKTLDFEIANDISFEKNDSLIFALYTNKRPYLHAEIKTDDIR